MLHRAQLVEDGPGWQTLSKEVAYQDPYTSVLIHRVKSPHHPEERNWTVVHRRAAVVVAPLTTEGRLVLVRQERIPVRALLWEFPAGQIDEQTEAHGEAVQRTALREMEEETGHRLRADGKLQSMGCFFSSVGFTDEHAYLFVAQPVESNGKGPAPDESESIVEVRAFTPEEVRRMIADGEIRDANTLCMFARMAAIGTLGRSPTPP